MSRSLYHLHFNIEDETQELQVTEENLKEMQSKECGQLSGKAAEYKQLLDNLLKEFMDAMDDDFNTALAISHMFTLAREIILG